MLEIVALIKSSGQFSEFHLKVGDVEVDVRRRAGLPIAGEPSAEARAAPQPAAEAPRTSSQRSRHVGGGELIVEPAAPAPKRSAAPAQTWPEGSVLVHSPMVGTFYRAPEPGAAPFVQVGLTVSPDTTVCIIEVMKLMNSIPAGASGVVTHILVEDGSPVEYGQPLIALRPQ
ncbi:MAG: acetyl-CoA carboxylase biotin carboxyl carrier protein [Betaproteobacteria bacterium]|nr:acetyl-CoA carboxylase biotin carboxyl carrier protein [Betaproteobacteria bacterium]MDE2209067.1 acetyl-CoA carboxylase biotin carboxyl carrier protein [Betaproteobacteria bacterium]MDE2360550.1 acetyl-CoA carboxylase biotin carboxyl carrier protein [Betaproteobacteria bacterium]